MPIQRTYAWANEADVAHDGEEEHGAKGGDDTRIAVFHNHLQTCNKTSHGLAILAEECQRKTIPVCLSIRPLPPPQWIFI